MSKSEAPVVIDFRHPFSTGDKYKAIAHNLLYPNYDDPIFKQTDRTVYLDPKFETDEEIELLAEVTYQTHEDILKRYGSDEYSYASTFSQEVASIDTPFYFEELLKTLIRSQDLELVHIISSVGTEENDFHPNMTFGFITPQPYLS